MIGMIDIRYGMDYGMDYGMIGMKYGDFHAGSGRRCPRRPGRAIFSASLDGVDRAVENLAQLTSLRPVVQLAGGGGAGNSGLVISVRKGNDTQDSWFACGFGGPTLSR